MRGSSSSLVGALDWSAFSYGGGASVAGRKRTKPWSHGPWNARILRNDDVSILTPRSVSVKIGVIGKT